MDMDAGFFSRKAETDRRELLWGPYLSIKSHLQNSNVELNFLRLGAKNELRAPPEGREDRGTKTDLDARP